MSRGNVLIALGANLPGPWGSPAGTLRRALAELDGGPTRVTAVSAIYETEAMGQPHQPPYLNAVARLQTHLAPEALLRLLKTLERRAGRSGGGAPWGPRALDLDILDYRAVVLGWRGRHPLFARAGRRPLILPHPHIQARGFVLRPLLDIAPHWRHPVLQQSGERLWRSLPASGRDTVRFKAPPPHLAP